MTILDTIERRFCHLTWLIDSLAREEFELVVLVESRTLE